MSLDARDSPAIQRLLERLPEFRPAFDAFVAEEEGELGSFWAMNELGRWAFPSDDEELLRRVFAAVDEVYADHSLVDGHDLAVVVRGRRPPNGDRHARLAEVHEGAASGSRDH